MDKKSIRINFNFNIAKNKNGRNNSHYHDIYVKNIALCMKMILIELLMNKLWLTLEMLLKNYLLKKVVM